MKGLLFFGRYEFMTRGLRPKMGILRQFISVLVFGFATMMASQITLANEATIKKALEVAVQGIPIVAVEKSRFDGLYEVRLANNQVLFSNADGSYFVMGELYSTKGGELVNLSERERDAQRAAEIAKIKPGDKITYPPTGEIKAKIAVFTDIDCSFCRKLHREIPRLNELGVEVSYLAFPRAGVGSSSYKKIVSAWCADDKLQAMTDAKSGKKIPSKDCDNPVAQHFSLGRNIGVSGTPAIILEDGKLIPGYRPADRLARDLGIK